MNIYVGDASNVVKRILTNHCSGNIEASALRRAVAEDMGYHLRRTKRQSGSLRVRIDLPDPRDGENMVSAYIRSGEWKYVICESYDEAHDFQWYVIAQLKPILNRNFESWDPQKTSRYQFLLNQLLMSEPLNYDVLRESRSGPGVYVLFHKQLPKDFKNSQQTSSKW